ncbi:hypothetical protein H3221_010730 [Pseudomonas sp. LMG 31766]|uniref:Uncharacterized protein n=1 Tax=Pseudomonas chaetocerotis TaxID=2758695 RepID=A0A931GF78_9PSED|nr:hypothetical protein [Pseudomonas chaetocerotis]MBZ9665226.1 hypothetical protein [Pseudomonas chaetocerotis]
MSKPALVFDPVTAIGFIGQTVLMELRWDDDDDMLWCCYHIVGVVLPVPGVFDHGYFLIMPLDGSEDLPLEVYFDSINTIRVVRDRHTTAKARGCLPLPSLFQGQISDGQCDHR